jgi:hypothetical protein
MITGMSTASATHIGDVAVAQVDLGRAARALDDHALELARQPLPGFQHCRHRHALVVVVGLRIQVGNRLAVDDDLGALVGIRLQQHGIEVDARRQTRGVRLQRLGATDFAPVYRHGRVQCHVLRLEWRDAHAAPVQHAAERRDQYALAGVGGAALYHECLHAAIIPCSRVCSASLRCW